MTVVDLNRKRVKRRDPRSLEQATGAARFFQKMVREIENDLGGRRQLSRIEGELIQAFCGAATQVQYLNRQVMLGEGTEIDLSGYATLASTMLRIGARLGFQRRLKDMTPTLDQYLAQSAREADDQAANDEDAP
jgi:hypothetical protein